MDWIQWVLVNKLGGEALNKDPMMISNLRDMCTKQMHCFPSSVMICYELK